MRGAIQWLGVAVVGTVLGAGCSSSDDHAVTPTEINRITPNNSAGTGGSEPTSTGGTAGSADFAGEGGLDDVAGAGEGGAGGEGGEAACKGNYECPAVLYWSHGIIKVDLPISVAEAANATFTACRNDECYTANGSARVDNVVGFDFLEPDAADHGWVYTTHGEVISLDFDGPSAAPFAVLDWRFDQFGDLIRDDHYSLTVQVTGADAPATTLFDGQVDYAVRVADPSLVDDGFCSHCSEVSYGTVDDRSVN